MDIYSVAEVAQHLDLHIETIKRYIKAGKLHATKKGRMRLILGSDLDNLKQSEWFQIERSMNVGRPKAKHK